MPPEHARLAPVPVEVWVRDDPAVEAAHRLAAAARAGGHIALCGGSTPRAAYTQAAELERGWSRATLWWGDERCVPPHDERSNYRLAVESLISRVEARPRIERMEGERGPDDGARLYEEALERELGPAPPVFDLMFLGIGRDGHCASLFPGAPSLAVHDRAVVGVERPGLEPFVPRLSLTVPALSAARDTVFLVRGEEKADAVRRAFAPDGDDVPARRVADRSATVTVLVDRAAAAELPSQGFRGAE